MIWCKTSDLSLACLNYTKAGFEAVAQLTVYSTSHVNLERFMTWDESEKDLARSMLNYCILHCPEFAI